MDGQQTKRRKVYNEVYTSHTLNLNETRFPRLSPLAANKAPPHHCVDAASLNAFTQ